MLRQSPHRALAVFTCCALCLLAGALPAAALPGLDSSAVIAFEPASWLARIWQLVGEPIASLFAADGTPETATAPPPAAGTASDAGIEIGPDGVPRP